MQFEVEQKFPVAEISRLQGKLLDLAARAAGELEQLDVYFNHPARDFALTDEALRLRRVGTENFVTYKGPKLDATTKTRREIELPLATGTPVADDFAEILLALGFHRAGEVRKTRRQFHVDWQGRTVEIALDDVAGLGQFVELELAAELSEVDAAKQTIASLAAELGLTHSERRSYLELLLARS